jgi:uncharacterized protein YndB with AHSA1/START domain
MIPGDQARASVHVKVAREDAFRIFTEEIDQWWRRGLRYRVMRGNQGILHLEPRVGGRLFEATPGDAAAVETGRVTAWEPPERFVFEWRAINFAPEEKTEVEVLFEARAEGTLVTVTHRGWAKIRANHPVRHGEDVTPFIRRMGMWWADLLTSLREHTET